MSYFNFEPGDEVRAMLAFAAIVALGGSLILIGLMIGD